MGVIKYKARHELEQEIEELKKELNRKTKGNILTVQLVDKAIQDLFEENWYGKETLKSLDSMKAQLYKNLNDQLDGYWSGSTAYYIMTKGGFLIDAKSGTKKQLTTLGELFMRSYEKTKKAGK